MKFKVGKKRGSYVVKGRTEVHETFDYAEAELVCSGECASLLAGDYSPKGKGYIFKYAAPGFLPLKKAKKKCSGNALLQAALLSFLDVAHDCDRSGLSLRRVCLDEQVVFYDSSSERLRFVYAPVMNRKGGEVDALLQFTDIVKHVKCDDDVARGQQAAALDFFQRSAFFSWLYYENLLESLGLVKEKRRSAGSAKTPSSSRVSKATLKVEDCQIRSIPYDFVQANAAPLETPQGATVVGNDERRCATVMVNNLQSWVLVRESDDYSWPLANGVNTVGRSPSSDIALDGFQQVSSEHAEIIVVYGQCSIRDVGSSFGTFVNGRKLAGSETCVLHGGDVVMLADVCFCIRAK